jgi:hypothetical protein
MRWISTDASSLGITYSCGSLQCLSVSTLEFLLKSEHLELASENDTFALVSAWIEGLPEKEQKAAFRRLEPCLRLQHMTTVFLASVVARSDFGLCIYHKIMDVIAYQSIASSLALAGLPLESHYGARLKPSGASRAPKEPAPFLFVVYVDLANCIALENGEVTYVMLGVVAGYRAFLKVVKYGEPATLGLGFGMEGLLSPVLQYPPGPPVQWKIQAGEISVHRVKAVGLRTGFSEWDFFKKPWEEVVCFGSPYFPQGRMPVSVTVDFRIP